MHLIKLLFYRHRSLFRHIRKYGISNGWWMWSVENNVIFDPSGEWLDITIQSLKQSVTQARWRDNDELADGLTGFIEDLKTFHKKCHPEKYK